MLSVGVFCEFKTVPHSLADKDLLAGGLSTRMERDLVGVAFLIDEISRLQGVMLKVFVS